MTSIFPFAFPLPTAFYLTLFVLTLAIHVIFMNYVLAGAAYLAFVSVLPGRGSVRREGPIALLLRDWMPFAISAAITAAVAPLLFLQILYKTRFYTANLLLFHRWMAIVPVLIVGFYLAYLFKSKLIARWGGMARGVVGVGMLLCLGFTAYSWTENHLLSMESVPTWAAFYGSGSIIYRNVQILPRLGVWVFGAFATMAVMVAWQLWGHERPHVRGAENLTLRESPGVVRTLAGLALGGLLLAGISGTIYLNLRDTASPDTLATPFSSVVSTMAAPWSLAAAAGAAAQAAGWFLMARAGRLSPRYLALITAACVVSIVSATAVREVIRIRAVDFPALYAQHARAANVGGLTVFLTFFVINAMLITLCFVLVKRGWKATIEA